MRSLDPLKTGYQGRLLALLGPNTEFRIGVDRIAVGRLLTIATIVAGIPIAVRDVILIDGCSLWLGPKPP